MTRLSTLSLVALAAALALPAAPAQAQVAFNASLTTDYRYRGISQTVNKPALQGGVDYAAGEFYIGAWGSTIKWIKDFGGDADVELDFYGGYKTEIATGLTADVGLLQYYYPSHKFDISPNTLEAYGALSFGPVTFKVSRSFTNLFGVDNSKGSFYYDLTANFDLGDGWSVTPHIGRQSVKNNADLSYTDTSLMVNKAIDAVTLSVGLVGTKKDQFYSDAGKDIGKRRFLASVKYSF